MTRSSKWRSILGNMPAALEETYHFEDGDSADVLTIPTDPTQLHRLAGSLQRERIQRQAERDKAQMAMDRIAADLKRVYEAMDEKHKEVGARVVPAYGDGKDGRHNTE